MTVFTGLMISSMAAGGGGMDWFAILFVGLFWMVGIGITMMAVHMGKRSAMVGVADGRLFIEQKSIFGTKWKEFEAALINQKLGLVDATV